MRREGLDKITSWNARFFIQSFFLRKNYFYEASMSGSKEMSLTEGKIYLPLIKFTVPIFLALVLQAMYGAVDMIVVGHFGTSADVSAVSSGSQILQMVTFVVVSLSMGTTVLVGLKIGAKENDAVSDVIGTGICLFAVIGVLMTAVLMCGAKLWTTILNAPKESFDQTVQYVFICGAGSLFIVAYNVLGSVFRGLGDSKTPLITVAIACVVNIFGDLYCVAVLHLGAAGAAIATVAAQGVSVVASLIIIKKQKLPFSLKKKNIRFNLQYTKSTLKLGVPIALQDFLVGISFLVILAIVNSLGLVASAGVGVAEKVCAFIMLVPSAFSQAMSVFVSQNRGAGKMDRTEKGLRYGIITSLSCGVVLFYLSFFHGIPAAKIFTNDMQVAEAAADYLKAYAIDCMLTSFLFCLIGYFNGMGKTQFVMIQGLIGAFGVRIPVSFLMSRMATPRLFFIGLATPCSTFVQIVICLVYFFAAHLSHPSAMVEQCARSTTE